MIETNVEPETPHGLRLSETNSQVAKPLMDKWLGDDRSGTRTGPEVMTGETTQLAPSEGLTSVVCRLTRKNDMSAHQEVVPSHGY